MHPHTNSIELTAIKVFLVLLSMLISFWMAVPSNDMIGFIKKKLPRRWESFYYPHGQYRQMNGCFSTPLQHFQ